MLEIYSCADLADEYTVNEVADSPAAVYRRARAREALLLAIYLHEAKVATWSLANETLNHMQRVADPKKLDDPKTHFTYVFVNYVKDEVLPGWKAILTSPADEGLKGSACDAYLLRVAQHNGVPLVTNEGYSAKGIDDSHGLRRQGRDAGARVFTPREYWSGKINPKRAARRFIQAFRKGVPHYLRHKAGNNVRDAARIFEWIDGYFHHVLLGIAVDGKSRVRVEL